MADSSISIGNRDLGTLLAMTQEVADTEYINNRIPVQQTLGSDNYMLWDKFSKWAVRQDSVDTDAFTEHLRLGILSAFPEAKRPLLLKLWSDAVTSAMLMDVTKNEVIGYHGNYRAALNLLDKLTPLLEQEKYDTLGEELQDILNEALDVVTQYSSVTLAEDIFVTDDLEHLFKNELRDGISLDWPLEELNLSIGPLTSGLLYLWTAPVETGKTLAVADLSRFFAAQVPPDRPVLWFNNEESKQQCLIRSYMSTLGVSRPVIELDIKKAVTDYKSKTNGALRIIDNGALSAHDIEAIVKEHNASVIFLDVADKFAGYEKEPRDDLRLQRLYQHFRDIAKKHNCAVVAISQADSSAMETQYFHYTQMSGSKVSKPGEADVIITMNKAKDPEPGEEMLRYLWVCKNKSPGGGRFEEAFRHAKWAVEIEPTIARFIVTPSRPAPKELTEPTQAFIKEWQARLAGEPAEEEDSNESEETTEVLRVGRRTMSGHGDNDQSTSDSIEGETRSLPLGEQSGESGDSVPEEGSDGSVHSTREHISSGVSSEADNSDEAIPEVPAFGTSGSSNTSIPGWP